MAILPSSGFVLTTWWSRAAKKPSFFSTALLMEAKVRAKGASPPKCDSWSGSPNINLKVREKQEKKRLITMRSVRSRAPSLWDKSYDNYILQRTGVPKLFFFLWRPLSMWHHQIATPIISPKIVSRSVVSVCSQLLRTIRKVGPAYHTSNAASMTVRILQRQESHPPQCTGGATLT